MTAQTFIKDNSGIQRQAQQIFVKDSSNTWRPIGKVWVKDSTNTWQQVFGVSGSQSIVYSTPGTTSWTVPAGVYSINLTYPATTGIITTSMAVTPGSSITITTGDYGVASTIANISQTITTPAYSTQVLNHFSGNVDAQVTQTFSVATDTSITYTTNGTNNAGSFSNFQSVGIYFNTDSETAQGDFGESVTINTVPKATLLGNFQVSAAVQLSGGYLASISQPTAAGNYLCQYQIGEGNRSNNPVTWQIQLTQQGYVRLSYASTVFNTSGAQTWTVPTGVYSVNVTTIGGGGGGGAGNDGGYVHYGYAGSGGGSGYQSSVTLAVTPGDILSIYVGSGGAGGPGGCGPGGSPGSVGTSSFVVKSGSIVCSAQPGQGGVSNAQTNNPGGAGGTYGSNGSATQGTGKGGDGGASTISAGGIGGPGGGCGNGSGSAGLLGAGGGGGGSQNGSCCGHPGGRGGDGLVYLSY